jgi:hypothetical protein
MTDHESVDAAFAKFRQRQRSSTVRARFRTWQENLIQELSGNDPRRRPGFEAHFASGGVVALRYSRYISSPYKVVHHIVDETAKMPHTQPHGATRDASTGILATKPDPRRMLSH